MTYAFTQDVPIDAATYSRIQELVGDEVPKGLIIHLVTERPEGGLRILDVWEAEEDCDTFGQTRLMPALRSVLGDSMEGPPPPRDETPVVHVWSP